MIQRSLFAAALLAASAVAAPPLTTIQDVLYKADGTRFNGTLTVSWISFQSVDNSAIVTQNTTVKVVDGNLRVQLVPSTTATPAINYTVAYRSDGHIQFQETWAVPSSASSLRVKDVRIATTNTSSSGSLSSGSAAGDTSTTIAESAVVGLVADLGARPIKGAGYAAGRVAMVNSLGALESVTGNASDCVRVDGSSGACGSEAPSFVDGDIPSGIVDGANAAFSLSGTPDPASSLAVYRNGLLLTAGQDYTADGSSIEFLSVAIPQQGDTLLASYRLTEDDSSSSYTHSRGRAAGGPRTAQVLCSGAGTVTSAATLASLGTCTIPAGALASGDRVEVRFDFEHQGTGSAFSIEVHWGTATVLSREAGALETTVTGRADAALYPAGATLSSQSWGAVLPLSATVAPAADAYSDGLTIGFLGKLAQATKETLGLRNYTVIKLP